VSPQSVVRPPAGAGLSRRARLSLAAVLALLALALIAAPASAGSAVTIGTVGAPGNHEGAYEFGGGIYVASIGQVVTVPAGVTSLESFSLTPQAPASFIFRGYVYAWSGTHTEGPALYESAALHAPGESGRIPLMIETGGVPVTPGRQYVLFLSRSNEQAADEASTKGYNLAIVRGEEPDLMLSPPPYREGGLVTLSNGYAPSEWASREWFDFSSVADAEFEASFDVPAPPIVPAPVQVTKTVATAGATPAPAPRCVVPYLGGLTLAAARTALSAAGCTLGKVRRHWFSLPSGELMEQNAHQGTILPAGAPVGIWLSRGRHQRRRGTRPL
jgi:hypothetical protein